MRGVVKWSLWLHRLLASWNTPTNLYPVFFNRKGLVGLYYILVQIFFLVRVRDESLLFYLRALEAQLLPWCCQFCIDKIILIEFPSKGSYRQRHFLEITKGVYLGNIIICVISIFLFALQFTVIKFIIAPKLLYE